jgi:hypothetical protein
MKQGFNMENDSPMRANPLRPSIAEPSIGDFGLLDHLDTINFETARDF